MVWVEGSKARDSFWGMISGGGEVMGFELNEARDV